MFQGWDGFYLMTGSAAAGLIGLMFVVATLRTGIEVDRDVGGRVYTTPIVFHLAVVLTISLITAVPSLARPLAALLIGACALTGFVNMAVLTPHMLPGGKSPAPHWSDVWCYGVAPAILYLGLGVAAALIWGSSSIAAYAAGALVLALLLIAIRNAWDLVTWLAPRAVKKD
jgi:hypothetical protein